MTNDETLIASSRRRSPGSTVRIRLERSFQKYTKTHKVALKTPKHIRYKRQEILLPSISIVKHTPQHKLVASLEHIKMKKVRSSRDVCSFLGLRRKVLCQGRHAKLLHNLCSCTKAKSIERRIRFRMPCSFIRLIFITNRCLHSFGTSAP